MGWTLTDVDDRQRLVAMFVAKTVYEPGWFARVILRRKPVQRHEVVLSVMGHQWLYESTLERVPEPDNEALRQLWLEHIAIPDDMMTAWMQALDGRTFENGIPLDLSDADIAEACSCPACEAYDASEPGEPQPAHGRAIGGTATINAAGGVFHVLSSTPMEPPTGA